MAKLRVVETTDKKFLGMVFELPDPQNPPSRFPVMDNVVFTVDKIDKLADKMYRYSNANYIAIVVEE